MDHALLKTIHFVAAGLSISGFVLRLNWMVTGSPLLQARLTRVVPHIVDTVLLASAIAMLIGWRLAPWQAFWLSYKVLALLIYIVLGSIALKRGRTRQQRLLAGVAAVLVFASIVAAAVYKPVSLGALFGAPATISLLSR